MFAKLAGAKSIIMDLCEERLNFAEKCMGSELSILATKAARQELLNLNDGVLPSVLFDATGNQQSMINAFDYVSHGGKLIYVGLVNETISFFHPDFHAKELSLLASRNALKKDF